MNELGRRLRAARLELGLTMAQVAERCGVHVQTIHRWETGLVTPETNRLMGVAVALGRPVEWFLGGDSPDGEVSDLPRRAGVFLGFLGEVFRSVGLELDAAVSHVTGVGAGDVVRVQGLDPERGDGECVVQAYGGQWSGVELGRLRAAGGVVVPMAGGVEWGDWVVVVDLGRRVLRDGGMYLVQEGASRWVMFVRWDDGWTGDTDGVRGAVDQIWFGDRVWGEVVWAAARSRGEVLGRDG